jgi:tetratricopeptide (TPR) repeat protein
MGGLSEDAPNDRAREVMRALASEAGLDPDVGDLLAVTLGVPLEGRNPALEHAQRDPQVMRDQMFSALGDFFEAKAALRPLLLVIEDVQWADTPSVECIDVLLRRAERCSLFVVVTARPHALEDRKDLLQSGLLTEHVVRDLSNKAARRLVAEALVQHGVIGFSESVSDAIAEHAGGNPFFISEIVGSIAVRYLKDGMEGFDPDAFALPMTVEGAVMSRLDHLEGGAKDLVKRASVLGIRFWSEALGELGCKSPAHTIRKLVRTGLVVRPARRDVRLSGFDEYGFRQRVVRDVAYGILTPDQRRVLHLAAGRWLSSVEAALPEETAGHLEKGGDTQAAAEWWARAAEAALARGDTRMSFEWFDRAVSGMTDPQRVTELRLKKVEGYYAANDFRGAESELAQIDVDVLKPALRVMARYWKCRIVMDSAVARDSRGDAVREMMDIAAEFESLEMAYWHGMALAKAALTSHYLDLSPGLPLAEKALEVGGNYPAVEAVSWDAIAMVHMYDDALDKAVHASREAAKAARRGGMLGMEVALLGDIAWIAGQLGRFDESKEALLEVMERSARFGNKRTAAYALHNLGLVHLNQGDLEQALEVEERALAMAHAGQNDRLVAYCRVYRAFILLALGRPDEASRSSTAALAFAKGTELEAAARTALAASLVEKGEVEAAALESSRAEELRQESGRMVEFGVELTLVRCSVLEASGDLKAARKLLGHAQSQVLERAQRLTDKKEERDVFLAIPAHQRLLALAS